MEITRRSYEVQWLSVLFEVEDGDSRFVCGISLDALAPDGGGSISGEEGLVLFDEQAGEILKQAEAAVSVAKAAGVQHVPGARNQPIFVVLPPG